MIVKKHISIYLTFIFLVSNLGMSFNVHYCDDKIEFISLKIIPVVEGEVDECCGIVEKDSKCCKDKVIKAEVKSDQLIFKSYSFTSLYILNLKEWKPIVSLQFYFKSNKKDTYFCEANAPPLYILFSQYIFYA